MIKIIEGIKLDGALLNEDFVIVSKVVMTDDFLFYPYDNLIFSRKDS